MNQGEDTLQLLCDTLKNLLLEDGSEATAAPASLDASPEVRLKAIALRLVEFEQKEVEPIFELNRIQSFAPGWCLIRDQYTDPGSTPEQQTSLKGFPNWLRVVFFDKMGVPSKTQDMNPV